MLGLFPLIAWLLGLQAFRARGLDARRAFLFSALAIGMATLASIELLSLFSAINRISLVVFWGVVCILTAVAGRRGWKIKTTLGTFEPAARGQLLLVALLVAVVGSTALLGEPNTPDSLEYHLARVEQWTHHQNVNHYPTGIIRQVYDPPFAEFALLQLRVLSGNNSFANFLQWFAWIGCGLAASLIAQQLGGGVSAQLWALVLALTAPMAILQGSSTQNDLVVAFWLMCVMVMGLDAWRGTGRSNRSILGAGAAAGLAVLTKGTALIYLLPIVGTLGLAVVMLKHRQVWGWIAAALLLSTAINLGHWSRNYRFFHDPLGPIYHKLLLANQTHAPAPLLVNVIRTVTLQLHMPTGRLSQPEENLLRRLFHTVHLDPDDPRTTMGPDFGVRAVDDPGKFEIAGFSIDEDTVPSPLHFLAIAGACAWCFFRPYRNRTALVYAGAITAGFLLFCALLKWQEFNSRLLVPLFVAGAPLAALIVGSGARSRAWASAGAILLLVAGIGIALGNRMHPWFNIGASPSMFHQTPAQQMFIKSSVAGQYEAFMALQDALEPLRAMPMHLACIEPDYEYPLWALRRWKNMDNLQLDHLWVRDGLSGKYSLANLPADGRRHGVICLTSRAVPALTMGGYHQVWSMEPYSIWIHDP